MLCLTGIRFNMKADILRQGWDNNGAFDPTDEAGEWVMQQDKESGDIIRVWQPQHQSTDNPSTPTDESLTSFDCEARGIVDGGIRVSGSTERFGFLYEDVDYVKITFPADVELSKRDRVTNIRDSQGNVIWKERHIPGNPPTIYEVTGVTPIVDPFGIHIESFALLKRSEKQK